MAADDFSVVLLAAVLVMIALFIAFGGTFETGAAQASQLNIREVKLSSFDVSWFPQERALLSTGGTLKHGLFADEKKQKSFSVPGDFNVGKINFKIRDTNMYGRLVFSVNGKVVLINASYPGDHEVSFPGSYFKNESVFSMEAESSGWKFWAPAVYIVEANVYALKGKVSKDFNFEVSNPDRLSSVTLQFNASHRSGGSLVVKVNGEGAWKGKDYDVGLDIPLNVISKGKNSIEFSTEENAEYSIATGKIVIAEKI